MDQISLAESITIPPGGTLPRSGLGNFLYLIEANGPLKIRSNLDDDKPFDVGTGLNYGGKSKSFNRLQIVNDNAGPVSVTIYRGFSQYVDNRLNSVSFRRNARAIIAPVARCISSLGETDLAEDEFAVVPNGTGAQQKISVFCITAGSLRVYNDSDDLIFSIEAASGSRRDFVTSQALKFVQGSGSGTYTFFRTRLCPSPTDLYFRFEDGIDYLFENEQQKEYENI